MAIVRANSIATCYYVAFTCRITCNYPAPSSRCKLLKVHCVDAAALATASKFYKWTSRSARDSLRDWRIQIRSGHNAACISRPDPCLILYCLHFWTGIYEVKFTWPESATFCMQKRKVEPGLRIGSLFDHSWISLWKFQITEFTHTKWINTQCHKIKFH